MKGRDWLYSSIPDSQRSSQTLSQIRIQFNVLEDFLHLVRKLAPEITGTWNAVHEMFPASETLSGLVGQIERAITEYNNDQHDRIVLLFYLAVVLAVITGLMFIYIFSTSLRRYIYRGEKEAKRTQKAILRLLDEMEIPAMSLRGRNHILA